MNEKQKKVLDFLKQNCFYLIILIGLLCFLAVGIVSLIPDEPEEDTKLVENNPQREENLPEETKPEDQPTDQPGEEPTEPVVKEDPEDLTYMMPVSGTVSVRYSGTVPVFSDTLKEWHMHQGVDITTSRSEPVMAVFAGEVETVYDDEMMGKTVVIRQDDGIRTIYQSLTSAVKVAEGTRVEKGTVIGLTGTSADGECDEGIHLHLAMVRDGAYIDPFEIIE